MEGGKNRIITALAVLMSFTAVSHGSDIIGRYISYGSPYRETFAYCYANPALMQCRADSSLTSISVALRGISADGVVDPQRGAGFAGWLFNAETYTKYKSSTLWGSASYNHEKNFDVVWNETADIDIVYPYVTADSVGGAITGEVYSFQGGYADGHGRWKWGITADYKAGLYYRKVDPRPRNVSGLLHISAGAAFSVIHGYDAALAIDFRKYRQSSDIEFKSELGVEKIYHLTGLGTRYKRFDGLGTSSYYDGAEYGVSLTLFPSATAGAVASVDLSRFSFHKVLVDLNKLPLVDVRHDRLHASAGWRGHNGMNRWCLLADVDCYRRVGTENIFGSAAVSNYPKVGEIETYFDTRTLAGVHGLWQYMLRYGGYVALSARLEYARRKQQHAVAGIVLYENTFSPSLNVSMAIPLGKRFAMKSQIFAYADLASRDSRSLRCGFMAETIYRISSRYALGISAQGSAARIAGNVNSLAGTAAVSFYL